MNRPDNTLENQRAASAETIEAGSDGLPAGIARVTNQALLAERYMPDVRIAERSTVRLAVFDFDGTSLSGNSPVMLVRYLRKHMRKSILARIIAWGAAYKMRLPQNEAWVRGLVFSVFQGKSVNKVNEFLWDFYAEKVAPRFRSSADECMRAHIERGDVVVCVSATFEPIIAAAMTEHPIMFGIATRMAAHTNGTYTDRVEGEPVEGPEKLAALKRFADQYFGEGAWRLDSAYGDHHSDRTLLAAAEHPHAVTPDRPLTRTAGREGYPILNWE